MERPKERPGEPKKEQQSYLCNQAYQTDGGVKQWAAIATYETHKIPWHIGKLQIKTRNNFDLNGTVYHLQQTYRTSPFLSKRQNVEVTSVETRGYLAYPVGYAVHTGGGWTGELPIAD